MLVQGGKVLPAWKGKTAVCIATGPSLTQAQLEVVRAAREADEVRVIAINDVYLVAPWADVLYFADMKWCCWQTEGRAREWPWANFSAVEAREAFFGFKGQKVSINGSQGGNPLQGVEYLRVRHSDGLSLDPSGLATGSNSGHQALNIAVLSGADPILLVGYDGKRGVKKHAFGDHPDRSEPPYKRMLAAMKTTQSVLRQLGVRVVNCTPGSAIDCFERGSLEGVLSHQVPASLSA